MLARSSKTQIQLAKELGVSRITLGKWMNGQATPASERREAIARVLGIPAEEWVEPAKGALKAVPKSEAPKSEIPRGAYDKAMMLEDMAARLMEQVRDDPTSTPFEKARMLPKIAFTLRELQKITDVRIVIFRLPIWKQIKLALKAGLTGHPEAAEAVARELRKLDTEAL